MSHTRSDEEKRTLQQVQDFEFERRQLQHEIELAKLRQEQYEAEARALQAQLTRDTLEANLRKIQAGGSATADEEEESKGDAAEAQPCSFSHIGKQTKSADWKALSQAVINEVTQFYMGHQDAARELKEHTTKFRASSEYREERLRHHKDRLALYADGGGRVQVDRMALYCQACWGFNPGDGFAGKYWEAMNAYDSSYEGITAEDFTVLNHWFDEQSILFLDAPELKVPDYSFDPNKKRAHKEDFERLSEGVILDARNFWRGQSREAQQSHLNHTKRFSTDAGYQKELFAKAFRGWVEIAPKNGIMGAGGRLHDFCQTQWGFNPGQEWGEKYWKAINAYDSTYEGIKVEDYLECWIYFDRKGVEMLFTPDKKFPYYKYDPESKTGITDPKACGLVKDLVDKIIDDWRDKPKHEKYKHMNHILHFYSRESYQNYQYQRAANSIERLQGEGQTLKEDKAEAFFQAWFETDIGETAMKYWHAMNAYDLSYPGVSAQDFVECCFDWDRQAMKEVLQEPDLNDVFVAKPDVQHSENFEHLRSEIVHDIYNHWRNLIHSNEGQNQKAHLEMFKDDDEHKTRLLRRVVSMWGGNCKDADGLMQEDELPVFMGDFWGHNMGEWGKKYWRAVNAYDNSYGGIKPVDFLICWIEFDAIAFKKIEEENK